jgi:hypothetical protein
MVLSVAEPYCSQEMHCNPSILDFAPNFLVFSYHEPPQIALLHPLYQFSPVSSLTVLRKSVHADSSLSTKWNCYLPLKRILLHYNNNKLGWNQSFKVKYFQLEIEHG